MPIEPKPVLLRGPEFRLSESRGWRACAFDEIISVLAASKACQQLVKHAVPLNLVGGVPAHSDEIISQKIKSQA